MPKFIFVLAILVAVCSVAIADVMLKKAAVQKGTLAQTFMSPWFLGAVVLYLVQIFIFTYAFVSGTKLSIVGIWQTVCYALIVLLWGVVYFKESLSTVQMVGMVLGIVSVALIGL